MDGTDMTGGAGADAGGGTGDGGAEAALDALVAGLGSADGPRWTLEEGLAFESAQDVIGLVIAGYSAQKAAERSRERPDPARLEELTQLTSRAVADQRALRVTDPGQVARVREHYLELYRRQGRP